MNYETIMAMMDKMAQTGITKFSYKKGDTEIKLENAPAPVTVATPVPVPAASAVVTAPVVSAEAPASVADDTNIKEMASPLIGTFYAAASPDVPPFVKVGDSVKKGQVVGIVEAMKLMNEIECEFDGEIVEILVSNEQTVEYGQPLFKIKIG
jgi:acetyl-CoA carboxylase biotin carboxyl carrier protein